MKIIVGTKNPTKVAVVLSVFKNTLKARDIEVTSYDAESNVPEAPHNSETHDGALNRATVCSKLAAADYYVGIESGLVERYGHIFEEAWAVVISSDGAKYVGYSSGLLIPAIVVKRMNDGEKHNQIMASFDLEFNLPDDNRDTWSRYSGGNISRRVSLEEALRNALVQLVASDQNLYSYKT